MELGRNKLEKILALSVKAICTATTELSRVFGCDFSH